MQIYDPATGTFTLAGRLPTPRIGHAAVLLDDGDVLVMGGQAAGEWDARKSRDNRDRRLPLHAGALTTPSAGTTRQASSFRLVR